MYTLLFYLIICMFALLVLLLAVLGGLRDGLVKRLAGRNTYIYIYTHIYIYIHI